MTLHTLSPEAAGTVGPSAQWTEDSSGASTQAEPLRCEFAGWLGDDLVSVNPDFVVSGTLADALRASDLTGFERAGTPSSRSHPSSSPRAAPISPITGNVSSPAPNPLQPQTTVSPMKRPTSPAKAATSSSANAPWHSSTTTASLTRD
ncbi:hypothetical protein IOD13_18125 [Brevibacterium casei]|nr:hypothetical protein [Brevibacterium casei]